MYGLSLNKKTPDLTEVLNSNKIYYTYFTGEGLVNV